MSRTVSARIPKELHNELRETCNKVGCAISDYITESIKFAMYGSSDFDFGDVEEDKSDADEPTKNSEEKILQNLKVELGKVYDENGKLIGTVKGYVPEATVTIIE